MCIRDRLRGARRLLRRSRSFGEQHGRQRDRDAALGEGSRLHLADRGDLGLSHAAHDGGARTADARHRAGAVPGRHRQAAQRAMVGERADRAADLFRVCEVHGGAVAHARRTAGADPVVRRTQKELIRSRRPSRGCEGRQALLIVRSVAFNCLFYLNLVLHVIGAIPTYALPRRAFMAMAKSWGYTSGWLLRVVAGTSVELRGLDKLSL